MDLVFSVQAFPVNVFAAAVARPYQRGPSATVAVGRVHGLYEMVKLSLLSPSVSAYRDASVGGRAVRDGPGVSVHGRTGRNEWPGVA
jgi:hypothetical protein